MKKLKLEKIISKIQKHIADIGANHDGNLGRAKKLINSAKAGADAAKFQHFKASTIVSDFQFKD